MSAWSMPLIPGAGEGLGEVQRGRGEILARGLTEGEPLPDELTRGHGGGLELSPVNQGFYLRGESYGVMLGWRGSGARRIGRQWYSL